MSQFRIEFVIGKNETRTLAKVIQHLLTKETKVFLS